MEVALERVDEQQPETDRHLSGRRPRVTTVMAKARSTRVRGERLCVPLAA